jgi:hypothetical protein
MGISENGFKRLSKLPTLYEIVSSNTECPALNSSKIKYFVSEMKGDIKLCASLFSMVTLPIYFSA